PVNRLRPSFRHRAETAAPGANVAEKHESCGAMVPALADVGTLSRFAHRMQSQTASQLFQVVEIVAGRSLRPQPLRLRHARRRAELDLNQLGSTGHLFDSTSSAIRLECQHREVLE